MKQFAFLFIAVSLLASCKTEVKQSVLLSGTIKNCPSREVLLNINSRMDTLVINADGSFSKEIAVTKPSDAMIREAKLYVNLYLVPGKDLIMTADCAEMNKDLSFAGQLAPENEYLRKMMENEGKKQENLFNHFKSPYTPDQFKSLADSIRLADLALLEQFANDKGKLDPDFYEREKLVIQFKYFGNLNSYPIMAGYYNTDKPVIPDNWYSFTEGVNLDDPSLLDLTDARYFISSYVTNQALKISGVARENSNNNPAVNEATFKYLKENFKNPEFFNLFAYETIVQVIDSDGPAGMESLIADYLGHSTDDAKKKKLQDKVDEWATMAKGKPAPVFNLPDQTGKMVSLTDFAGKYVFIDFWATWCGPCKAEVPAYKQLISDYKGKNMVFISISVDKDKAAWEKMLREGVPDLYSGDGQSGKTIMMDWLQLHDAVKYNKIWLVKFIPTFVLVDQQGNILESRAKRPSDPELRKYLDGLAGI